MWLKLHCDTVSETDMCFNLRVFYQTSQDISPGQELLVHYGNQYAGYMGIWEEYNFSLVTLLSVLLPSLIKINIIISFSRGLVSGEILK